MVYSLIPNRDHLQSLLDLLASLHLQSLLSHLFLLPFLRRPTS